MALFLDRLEFDCLARLMDLAIEHGIYLSAAEFSGKRLEFAAPPELIVEAAGEDPEPEGFHVDSN